jgi:hypothetical protein
MSRVSPVIIMLSFKLLSLFSLVAVVKCSFFMQAASLSGLEILTVMPFLTVLAPKDAEERRIYAQKIMKYTKSLDRLINSEILAIKIGADDEVEDSELKNENDFEMILKSRPEYLFMPMRRYLSVTICRSLYDFFINRDKFEKRFFTRLFCEKIRYLKIVAESIPFTFEPHFFDSNILPEYDELMYRYTIFAFDPKVDNIHLIEAFEALGYSVKSSLIPLSKALRNGKYASAAQMLSLGATLNAPVVIKALLSSPKSHGKKRSDYLRFFWINKHLDVNMQIRNSDLIEMALESSSSTDIIDVIDFLITKKIRVKEFQVYERFSDNFTPEKWAEIKAILKVE